MQRNKMAFCCIVIVYERRRFAIDTSVVVLVVWLLNYSSIRRLSSAISLIVGLLFHYIHQLI